MQKQHNLIKHRRLDYLKLFQKLNKRLLTAISQGNLDQVELLIDERDSLLKTAKIKNKTNIKEEEVEYLNKSYLEILGALQQLLGKTEKQLISTKKEKALVKKYQIGGDKSNAYPNNL